MPTFQAPRSGTGTVVGVDGPGASPSQPAPTPEEQLQPLRIHEEIGRGAMSVVHRATRGADEFAIKLLVEQDAAKADRVVRFRKEIATMCRLNHPSLVKLHDAGEYEGRPFLLLDLVTGGTLADAIARGPMPVDHVVKMGKQIAGGLAEMHRQGLVHRDVSATNIMLTAEGDARLIDLGFAIGQDAEDQEEFVGKIAYAPPEQTRLLDRGVDGRADLYSLGVTMFEVLAGSRPYDAPTPGELMKLHLSAPIPNIAELVPVGPALAAIISKLLAKDPDDRYQTGAGLVRDLDRLEELDRRARTGKPLDLGEGELLAPAAYEVPFVGRENDLAALHARLAALKQGRGGHCLIQGEGGLGKSRLCRELVRKARSDRYTVLASKCNKSEQLAFGLFRDAVDRYLSRYASKGADEREAAYARVRKLSGHLAPLLQKLSLAMASVLDVPSERTTQDVEPEKFVAAIVSFFSDLARAEGGLVLLADDVQWMDDGSLQVLSRLSGSLADVPLLILGTSRNDAESLPALETYKRLMRGSISDDLTLGPLDIEAVELLISAHVGNRRVDRQVVERLATTSHGNPFVVGEYLRALIDNGDLELRNGQFALRAGSTLASLELSTDVLDVIAGRVQTLATGVTRVLQLAAVIGNEFTVTDLLAVSPPGVSVAHALVEGVRNALLSQEDITTYEFAHDRIRETLLTGMPVDARRNAHQAIAASLVDRTTPAELYARARHLLAAYPERDPAAVYDACLAAGRYAQDHYASDAAHDFLSSAHRYAAAADCTAREITEVAPRLARACVWTARYDEAFIHFVRALEGNCTELERARIRADRVFALSAGGWHRESFLEGSKVLGALGFPWPSSIVGIVFAICWHWPMLILQRGLKWGYGTARGPEAERRRIVHALLQAALPSSYFVGRPDWFLLAGLLMKRNALRLGLGPELIEATSWYGLILGTLLLKRRSYYYTGLAFRDAEQLGDRVSMMQARLDQYFVAAFAGESEKAIETGLRNLPELKVYHTSFTATRQGTGILLNMNTRGEARRIVEFGKQELATVERSDSGLYITLTAGLMYANYEILGERGDAVRWKKKLLDYQNDEKNIDSNYTRGYSLACLIAGMLEREDFGHEIDEMIDELVRLHLIDWFARWIWMIILYVRLAQYERAEGEARSVALKRLRTILRIFRLMALHPVHRCHYFVARGALARSLGRHRGARRLLARALVEAKQDDSPLGIFSSYLEHARLARAMGDKSETKRWATMAAELAEQHGWRPRQLRVEREFDVAIRPVRTTTNASVSEGRIASLEESFQTLFEVTLASSTSMEPRAQAVAILDRLVTLLSAERALLFLSTPAGAVELEAGRNDRGEDIEVSSTYSTTVVGKVLTAGHGLVVTGTEGGLLMGAESAVAHGIRSIIATPIRLRDRVLGVLYLDSQISKGLFMQRDLKLLDALAGQIAVAREMARQARLEASRAALEKDLEVAAAVQKIFMPSAPVLETHGLRVIGFSRSADQCGGDWWAVRETPTGLSTVIGDVSGHGIASAMLTGVAAVLYDLGVEKSGGDPTIGFGAVSHEFERLAGGQYFVAFSALDANATTGHVVVHTAGGAPHSVVRANGEVSLTPVVSGYAGGSKFAPAATELQLNPGDRVLLMSDGVHECELGQSKQLGFRQLRRIIEETTKLSLEAASQHIIGRIDELRRGEPQADDLTFVLLERIDPNRPTFQQGNG